MYGYYYFDPTYLLLVIGMVLSLLASAKVKSTFSVYSRVRSASGLTGADAARRILRMSGITDVTVVPISGSLTDHYDPGSKKLALSQDVYDKTSVAAIGVAAHECGHAIQLCAIESSFCDCACCKHRFHTFLAIVSGRTDFLNPSTADCWNHFVYICGSFSACNSSGRIQCFFKSVENAWKR